MAIPQPTPGTGTDSSIASVLLQVKELLDKDFLDEDLVHRIKTLLYVSIEQLGIKIERQLFLQRMLREILAVLNTQADLTGYERKAALHIVQETEEKYRHLCRLSCLEKF